MTITIMTTTMTSHSHTNHQLFAWSASRDFSAAENPFLTLTPKMIVHQPCHLDLRLREHSLQDSVAISLQLKSPGWTLFHFIGTDYGHFHLIVVLSVPSIVCRDKWYLQRLRFASKCGLSRDVEFQSRPLLSFNFRWMHEKVDRFLVEWILWMYDFPPRNKQILFDM